MSRQRKKPKPRQPAKPAAGGDERPRVSRIEIACWAVLLAAAVGALIWNQRTSFFYSWTDEQIHFYVARRMAEGAVLYRDIDSARPPLVLLPLAGLIRIGCSPLLAGRALVLAFQLGAAGLLFWGGWRLASWRAGALAALLFLTSPEVFSRVHYTGIQLAALTASACVLFCLRGQPLRAGLAMGLTLAAGQHGLVICGVAALSTVARRRRDAFSFALGALAVSVIVYGGVWVRGGRHLWEDLVGIHLHHLRVGEGVSAQFWEVLKPWLYEHGYLFAGAGVAIVLLGRKNGDAEGAASRLPSSRVVRRLVLVVGAHVGVVLAMKEPAFLYIVVIAPLLTLLAGMGFDAAVTWWRQRSHQAPMRYQRVSGLMLGGAVAVVALTAGGWAAARSYREGLDDRRYSFWPQLLHGQVSRFQQLDVALRGIGESMLPKEGTIFGDPTIVSALALHGSRRVSGELADLNPTWIQAGTVSPKEVISRIEGDAVSAVITPPFGLVQDRDFKSYLRECYETPKPFYPPDDGPGQGLPFFLVFTHSRSTTACRGL